MPCALATALCQRATASAKAPNKAVASAVSNATLRTTMFGGPQWVPEQIEQHVRAQGLTEVRIILPGPGVPVVFVVVRHG